MRLGVLDIGSNTGHLLVVDAHGGAAPLPAYSYKEPLRLAEHLVPAGPDEGAVSSTGIEALTDFTAQANTQSSFPSSRSTGFSPTFQAAVFRSWALSRALKAR